MPPVLIEGLPTEILQDISEILDNIHPSSLLALARASKRCYAVASTVLFRTVKVTIADGEQRCQDARQLEERLLRDDAFAHVRRIILFSHSEGLRYPYLSLHPCERGREDDTALWHHLDDDKWPIKWPLSTVSIVDDEWEPVIHLLRQLTGLTDLFWACPEQLPLCLLQVLHERISRCRLHHSTFNPSSPIPTSFTSYERAIITSPCLYSIGGLIHRISPTTLKLVRSFRSPGLRRSYFWWRRRDLNIEAEEQNTENVSSLAAPREFIQVDGPRLHIHIPFAVIYKETAGDFSAMRSLRLNVPLALQGLPAPTDFPSLVTLTFTCVKSELNPPPPEYWDEVTTLLRNIPHLTTLQIKCWNRAISFIPSLSRNLRKLDLGTHLVPGGARLRDDHIRQLAEICPNLQHLTLDVRRSRGDAAEVERYRSLGRLPRLQELHIYLDASPPGYQESAPDGSNMTWRDTAIEPWFDAQDTKYLPGHIKTFREGHVRDVLVNSAIDASLALSIFKVIDGAKPSRSPGRAAPLPLERLELCARGGEKFADRPVMGSAFTPLNQFLAALKREWRVERDVRDDSRGILHVEEVGRGIIMRRLQPASGDRESEKYWFRLWRRVWPVEREGMHWWDDWESRPLELRTDESAGKG